MIMIAALCISGVVAFAPCSAPRRAISRVYSAPADANVQYTSTGNNVKITESLQAYVDEKIQHTVSRYGGIVTRCDTHLSLLRNPSVSNAHSAEVVVFAPHVGVVRAEERSGDMYTAIDLVSAKIGRQLRKVKERREGKSKPKISLRDEGVFDLDAGRTPDVPDAPVDPLTLVRKKSFPMPLQSLADAMFCLEALDHDFYVFKNADTSEVNVLYKRREGGLGLIEPEL